MDFERFLPKTLINILIENDDFVAKPFFLEGTVVFADISGFTKLSENLLSMGREAGEFLTKTINFYFDNIIKIVYEFGGDVIRFAGDAITIFFQGNKSQKNAIYASKLIQNFMKENEICHCPMGDISIKIKIGIASGENTLMILGRENFFDYVFCGEPVDKSAEAEHNASAGEIVLYKGFFEKIKTDELKINIKNNLFNKKEKSEIKALKNFINPYILEKISSGYQGLLNEHRKATILFVSFENKKEDLNFLQNFYLKVREIIDKYEGYLNKIDMGDKGSKFLIIFGAPILHEDDAERAIIFSKKLLNYCKNENIPISFGINSGTIFSGIVGNNERCEYTVMGDAVNLSARLMQYSKKGEIIVSSSVKEQASLFSFKYIGSVKLKGKSKAVEIFIPTEEREEFKEEEFFIQRKELSEKVGNFLKEKKLIPKLLSITGEAGVGKSAFFKSLLKNELKSYQIFYGRCQEFSKNFPYYPWKKVLNEIFNNLFSEKINLWQNLLKEKYPEIYKFSFILLDFLEIENNIEKIKVDENTKKSILNKEILILLNEISKLKKIAIVLNNFQWADTSTVELFYNICITINTPSPLFIVIGRESIKDLSNALNFLSIKIENFNFFETKEFALKFLNCKNLQEKVLKEIFEGSKGHPLLIKETLKNYLESGYLIRDKLHPEIILIDETKKPQIPTTLEEIVLSKFDKISTDEQFLLKIFSVFGQNIPLKIAKKLIKENKIKKETILKILKSKEFLSYNEKAGLYYFTKNHIRSSIYNSLDFKSRRNFHKIAAETYKEFFEDQQIIAYHYIESNKIEDGIEFILSSGKEAYKNYSFPSAIYYFNSLFEKKELLENKTLAEVLLILSDSMIKLGKFNETRDLLKENLIEKIKEPDLKSSLYLNLADTFRLTGNFSTSENYIEKAKENTISDFQKFKILNTRGTMLAQMSRYNEALKIFEEIEKNYKFKVPEEEIEKTKIIKGTLLFAIGKKDEAFKMLEKLKIYFTKKFEIYSVVKILHNLGTFALMSDEHKKALRYYNKSKDYQEKYGIYQILIITLNEIGYEYMLLSKWEKAEYYFNYALSLSKKFNDPFEIKIICNLNELNQYFGKFKNSRNFLKKASNLSYSYNFLKIDTLFYWIEFLSNIPYPKAIIKFIEKIKIEIERQRADYIKLLIDGYLSYYYYLIGNFFEAKKVALYVYKKAKEVNLKKELFLSLRTLILCSKEKEKYLKEIMDISNEIDLNQYKIEAIILNLKEKFDKNLVKKGDYLLKKAPFANLLWKFNTIVSEHFIKNKKFNFAKKRLKKAYNTYEFILQNFPSEDIKNYFESQDISKKLINLYYGTQTPPTGPSPQI